MKKRITLTRMTVFILALLAHEAIAALFPTKPEPVSPANEAVKVDLGNPVIQWTAAVTANGEPVVYDLYLGTSPSPLLFRSSVYDGWMDPTSTEFVFEMPMGQTTVVEFLATYEYLSPMTKYYWKVVARDSDGGETHSSLASFTTARENSYPSAPQEIFPTANASNIARQPTLKWTPAADPDGDPVSYDVYLGTNATSLPVVAQGLTTNTYTLPVILEDQQTYYWRVVAIDGYDGGSVFSQLVSFTVENYINDPPATPVLTLPVNGSTNTGNNVRLVWGKAIDKDGDPVTYDVYIDRNGNPSTRVAENLTATFYDVHLDGAHAYYWNVVARDNNGNEKTSTVSSFFTWTQAPAIMFEMVDIEGGSFSMGQSDTDKIFDGGLYHDVSNENPAHPVTVSSFQMSRFEVTNGQYVQFLNAIKADIRIADSYSFGAHPHLSFYYRDVYLPDQQAMPEQAVLAPLCQVFDATQTRPVGYEPYNDSPILWDGSSFTVDPPFVDHPVRFIYYTGAKYFGEWAGYELPSEAEWEYAALGGTLSHGYTYSGSNTLADVAADRMPEHWFATQPVGSKQPNELGLYDMSGNVAEICMDRYHVAAYSKHASTNPVAPSAATRLGHTLRGGIGAILSRVKSRDYHADGNIETTGIRLVKRAVTLRSVTGIIRRPSGRLQNVTIKGLPVTVTSDRLGEYFVAIPNGWSGTLTPELSGYRFTPESITVNNLRSDAVFNFSAALVEERVISGQVLDDAGVPMANVVLIGGPTPATTAADGTFTVKVYKEWTGSLTPTLQGYTFTPQSREFTTVTNHISDAHFTGAFVGTHILAGKITDLNGKPLAEVTLSGLSSTVITDAAGTYTVQVTAGWKGTITPSRSDYTFAPTHREIVNIQVNQLNEDFTGTYTGDYIIAGTISDQSGTPLAGVTVTASSHTAVLTDATGEYIVSVPRGWSGTITPELKGYQFTPETVTITDIQLSLFDQNFTGKSTVTSIDNEYHETIGVFPNPSMDRRFFVRADGSQVLISVFNSVGTRVDAMARAVSNGLYEVTLPMAGVYNIVISQEDRWFVKRVVCF